MSRARGGSCLSLSTSYTYIYRYINVLKGDVNSVMARALIQDELSDGKARILSRRIKEKPSRGKDEISRVFFSSRFFDSFSFP